jgi:hypothetical protein
MRRFLSSLLLVTICLVAMPVSALAFDPFGGACNGVHNQQDSTACNTSSGDPISGNGGILLNITNIVAYFAGAIAVIMIIVGAIRFITSGTDVSTGSRTDTDVEEARRTVASALVGLAVIILAKAIITYVVRRL